MNLANAYHVLYIAAIIVLTLLLFFCLIRAIKGPEVTDRIVATNMMGTMIIMIICVLALMLDESYLLDVALIYAMISFLAVVVLTKVYTGVYKEKKQGGKK